MAILKTKTIDDNPLQGNLVFYQNCLAPLESGSYSIEVQQQVSSGDGRIDETYINKRDFAVTGPRFNLDPSLISSVYPPYNANGEYSNVLPHVCFTGDSLPWERSVGSPDQRHETADVPPWLGVLVIAQDEGLCEIRQRTLRELSGAGSQTPDVFFPGPHDLEIGESWDNTCMTIDIPVSLFHQIAPSYDDLSMLGHVREVQAGSHAESYLAKLKAMSDEHTPPRFATVIANRLPAKGQQNLAVLVSFENFGDYLPANDGTPSPRMPASARYVRMVMLLQWRFFAVDQNETFSGYLLNLNKHDAPGMTGFLQLPARDLPGGDNSAGNQAINHAVNNALNMGYVPLDHHTRQGDDTVSWYRGPFLPYAEKPTDVSMAGPDSVTAYNPDTGMFDVSYAAAFQIGRLLALQNSHFAQTLYHWKQQNVHEAIAGFEADIMRTSLEEIAPAQKGLTGTAPKSIDALLIAGLHQILRDFVSPSPLNHADENK